MLQFVVGYAITESVVARIPGQEREASDFLDGEVPIDAVAAEKLNRRPDRVRSFDVGLDALITGLLT
ncbi:MAG: hypothetical protein QM784_19765 [Polyangiaceae bacterium]